MFDFSSELTKNTSEPLYKILYDNMVKEITSGSIRAGEKLPSKRRISYDLGVSMSTVETVYSLLAAEGYIESKPRSGYYACQMMPLEPLDKNFEKNFSPKPEQPSIYKYQFSTSGIDTDIFPYSTWAKLMKDTIYNGRGLLTRGDSFGDRELREALCAFLHEYRGAQAQSDQIIIGSGIQFLLDRLYYLLPPDSAYAFEDPTYLSAYRTLKEKGANVCSVPLDEAGMRSDRLFESMADIAYVTPSHQFPTGVTMPAWRRRELIAWAQEKEGRYIIEDDYDSEFRYSTRPIPCMQGLTGSDRVIYMGTFSRTIASSLRIAYMILPRHLVDIYKERYGYMTCTVSRFEQQALAKFISSGQYGRHLRRAALLYKQRIQLLTSLISDIPRSTIRGAEAGLHFMLTVPSYTENELIARAAEAGIKVHGLSEYYAGENCPESTLVLGFAGLDEAALKDACAILKNAWNA